MKENTLKNLIPQFSNEEGLRILNANFGKYGAIFSKLYNQNFLLPSKEHVSGNVIKGHDDSIRITFKILYRDFISVFHRNKQLIKEACPTQICYVDQDEMMYAFFLASIEEVVFLDSTDGDFVSGLLFLPENIDSLSNEQVEITHHLITSVLRRQENRASVFEIMKVPHFTHPEQNFSIHTLDEIKKELDPLLLKNQKHM